MKKDSFTQFVSPTTKARLRLADARDGSDGVVSGRLEAGDESFPIDDGIPNFVDPKLLSAVAAASMSEYDRVADSIYDVAVDWQFSAFREDENVVRESMVDLLVLKPKDRVLEVGAGTGRDSFRLARRLGASGVLHMQDLSPAMVRSCRQKVSALHREKPFACALEYSISNATELPFPDGWFDSVFHFGGFNQFGDLKGAAAELARVTRIGGRVLFGDEAVAPWLKGTEFEGIVTTNNPLFKTDAPLDALPVGARDVTIRWLIANCFYVIAFTKGEGTPPLDLDLPHKGWRGGTMRSRYFGVLEGVTLEAKELAKESAKRAGVSVHEWLDKLIKRNSK